MCLFEVGLGLLFNSSDQPSYFHLNPTGIDIFQGDTWKLYGLSVVKSALSMVNSLKLTFISNLNDVSMPLYYIEISSAYEANLP